ncbi:Glycosyl transferases group 1 [Eubacterium maltosivorans]|uniref:glycosyltransferase n=1 Tax=Eubacterium maltosivorans TaxID=2041044 RepID=UPI00087EC266|nr:glycosyltransferase [Eubacterium maltosivorans]WPK80833.1 hypothetical protein EUMA32_22450 [Eubacterium maltosivorans]SDP84656.1 Glycosyl transferases group 1 [Eubacterium maltosivorans]
MKDRLLFITSNSFSKGKNGGAICSERNYTALNQLFETSLYRVEKKSNYKSFFSILENNFPPLRNRDIDNIIKQIKNNNIKYIFFDGTIFGKIAKEIACYYPNVKIISYFHNVEYDYMNVRMKSGLKKSIYKKLVYNSEKLITKYSNYLISLNKRDKKRIKELYCKDINLIIPITLKDTFTDNIDFFTKSRNNICLIVGSYKRDMINSIKWYSKNISPYINAKTLLVGNNLEKIDFDLDQKIELIGSVNKLNKYYTEASCVVLPITEGAGMKVKTAESLMYAKTIFGTQEAFEGYRLDYSKIGAVCQSANEFVNSINSFFYDEDHFKFNSNSRKYFKENYSIEASDQLFQIMKNELAKI